MVVLTLCKCLQVVVALSMPQLSPVHKLLRTCRLESPRLSMNYNGMFSLKFSVRAGVDLSSVMAEIVKQFGASEAPKVTMPRFTAMALVFSV